jgi:ABC-type Mn2+/Zn2+ transport system ATPase subunit
MRWPGRAHWGAVDQALARVGLSAFGDRQIGELSGGQRRRVFVARALAQEADVLILDEPFSGVDASAQAEMMAVLDGLHASGLTILLCTHDLNLAFQRFDRVLALKETVIAYGPPGEVYTREVLTQLYGDRLATTQDDQHLTVFVDDHECC